MKEDYSPLEPLAGVADVHDEDGESVDSLLPSHRRRQQTHWSKRNMTVAVALFLASNLISVLAGGYFGQRFVNLDRRCAEHTVQYSPVIKEVDIHYEFQNFNGTFLQENVYRLKAPSPETDRAWEALGVDYRAGVISTSDGLKSGLTTSHVQRSAAHGGGFFVNVEGLHHLHCLNLVRKSVYYNYQYYKDLGTHAFSNDDPILQLHVSHCIDIIRQVLMCNVDTGVLGQVWAMGSEDPSAPPSAFPDFNTRHKCKNYDDVRQWAERMQQPPPETLPDDYMLAPGPADVLPATP